MSQPVVEKLQAFFPNAVIGTHEHRGDQSVDIERSATLAIAAARASTA